MARRNGICTAPYGYAASDEMCIPGFLKLHRFLGDDTSIVMSTHISISSIILSPAIEIPPPNTANFVRKTGLAPHIFFADSRYRVCQTCIAER